MLITSTEFLCFILLSMVMYYSLPRRFRWLVLLASSIYFYCSFDLTSVIYLGLTILATYSFACWLGALSKTCFNEERHKNAATFKRSLQRKKRAVLSAALILDFASLVVLKYSGFFLKLSNNVFNSEFMIPAFFLPLGISFYVFQSAGYLIDVYRGKYAQTQTRTRKYYRYKSI